MNTAGTKVAVQFFAKSFGKTNSVSNALPALIAISAFGNLIAVTFVSAKGIVLRRSTDSQLGV